MRRGGTPIARASAVCDKPIGVKNSSIRISPGLGFGRSSVVVDDLDFVGMALSPDKANTPLIVDSDGMLPATIPDESFQPVAGRHPKILQRARVVNKTKLSQRNRLDIREQPATAPPGPYRP